jgi:hypothetical protein
VLSFNQIVKTIEKDYKPSPNSIEKIKAKERSKSPRTRYNQQKPKKW